MRVMPGPKYKSLTCWGGLILTVTVLCYVTNIVLKIAKGYIDQCCDNIMTPFEEPKQLSPVTLQLTIVPKLSFDSEGQEFFHILAC